MPPMPNTAPRGPPATTATVSVSPPRLITQPHLGEVAPAPQSPHRLAEHRPHRPGWSGRVEIHWLTARRGEGPAPRHRREAGPPDVLLTGARRVPGPAGQHVAAPRAIRLRGHVPQPGHRLGRSAGFGR